MIGQEKALQSGDVGELASALAEIALVGLDGARVVVRDKETGAMSTLNAVHAERHDEADGSTTVWLLVEEM